ncbi:MAG: DUF3108 domain-containing protein [Gemmatimonadaceae bacterium]
MNRVLITALTLVLSAAIGQALVGQEPVSAPLQEPGQRVPFGVGEVCVYDIYFGPIRAGSGRAEIVGIEDMRGRPAYHIVFTLRGGTFFYKVDDRYENWIDTATLASLRYVQHIHEGGYKRNTTYDIYPERAVYTENGGPETASVSNPLDDGSFIYFIRTVPMDVGQRHEFQRYFKPDRNPVILQAVRKERIDIAAGKFDALVIHPTIKAKGLFAEDGRAEVYLSTDARRIMLAMKTKLSFGSLNLYLKSYTPAKTAIAPTPIP